jgi:hypothetical protein
MDPSESTRRSAVCASECPRKPLTPQQIAFAKMLGRMLANAWRQESRKTEPTPAK